MSGELIRYNGEQHGLTKISTARRTMDLALATLRDVPSAVIEARPHRAEIISPRQAVLRPGSIADVPRICAVHNRVYVSRYVMSADGFFHYGQGIRFTTKSSDQYGSEMPEPIIVPSSDLEDETCPWCGASGFMAILCNVCHHDICYGKTIANTFFHCRDTCTGSGKLRRVEHVTRGLRPELDSSSNPFNAG